MHAMRIGTAALVVAAGVVGAAAAEDFHGFYAGVLGSGVHAMEDGGYFGIVTPPPDVAYDFTMSATGGGIGGLIGHQLPWQQFVLGIEGDLSLLLGISDTFDYTGGAPPVNRGDAFSVSALAHIRGIVGRPVPGITPFIAGGIALAHVTQSHTNPDVPATWTQSGLQVGASIGAGFNYSVTDNMILRVEGLADIFAPVHYEWTASPLRYTDAQLRILTVRAGLIVALD